MAKKPAKAVSKKPAPKQPAVEAKAKAAAAPKKPMPKAEPAQPAPVEAAAPGPVKAKPAIPPRPVPSHQQFLTKGVKPQHMSKARIIRHQGR